MKKVIDALDTLGLAVLEEVGVLVLLSREVVDFPAVLEDEVMGARDHVQVLQSVILLAQLDSYFHKGSCAAEFQREAGFLPMHDYSDRLVEPQLLFLVNLPPPV